MDITLILIILLLVLGSTIVFYATHTPSTLNVKTGIAAIGFLSIFIGVALTGAY